MAVALQIDGAAQLAHGVWRVNLSSSEVRLLGPACSSNGNLTVALVNGSTAFDAQRAQLIVGPSRVTLLNLGKSSEVILIADSSAPPVSLESANAIDGDQAFLTALPPHLRELGARVISAVRGKFTGRPKFYQESGRYVETPDNFWTIKSQPRDGSFRITVRGAPEAFLDVSAALSLMPDRNGYSTFKITHADQIEALLRVLTQARRR